MGVLRKGVLEICRKFTGGHPCRSAISLSQNSTNSHFGIGVLLLISCTFPEYLFLRTPLEGCFCNQTLAIHRHRMSKTKSEQTDVLCGNRELSRSSHNALQELEMTWRVTLHNAHLEIRKN